MKKILLALVVCFVSFATAANAGNDKPINFEQLPANTQTFIKTHFPKEKVSYAKMESEFFSKSYDVIFVSGIKLEFSNDGEWTEINCKYSSVPTAIIPQEIAAYVKQNYTSVAVVELEKKSRGYEVKLGNGIELEFDNKFTLTDIDIN